jgi:hypothetical protein
LFLTFVIQPRTRRDWLNLLPLTLTTLCRLTAAA